VCVEVDLTLPVVGKIWLTVIGTRCNMKVFTSFAQHVDVMAIFIVTALRRKMK